MPAIHAMTAITCSALIHSYIRDAWLVCGGFVLASACGTFDLIPALLATLIARGIETYPQAGLF
jgi:hypothetical protein